MTRSDVAVVVIGRNEAARLDRCLHSLGDMRILYVDSGSVDGSPDRARMAGAEVIELDPAAGFSAARGRNAGLDRLIADPGIAYVQMVDGDCTIEPGWIAAGAAALDADPTLGAVFGQLREARPEASIYAWLLDLEWRAPQGPSAVFSGNVMLRAEAVRRSGRYRDAMIAGEDPEYAIRMRAAGWHILCLAAPMAVHSAGMARFGQWWWRTARAGHGFAELDALHPRSPLHDFGRSRWRILFWAGIVPLVALTGLALAVLADPRWIILAAAAMLLVVAQLARIALREAPRHGPGRAAALALFLTIGKYAEMTGLLRFHLASRRRRPRAPIDGETP